MTEIQCIKCEKTHDLFEYDLNEAAVLTCPTCGTQFNISASIKQTVKPTEKEPGMDMGMPEPPPMPAATPSPSPGAPAVPGELESKYNAKDLEALLDSGMDINSAINKWLGEKETKEKDEWKGSLATFNTKLQELSDDLGFGGDLGDLVSELKDGDALDMKGDAITLDIDKAKNVLVRYNLMNGTVKESTPMSGEIGIEGDLLDTDVGMEIGKEVASKNGSMDDVEKALLTYFG